MRLGLGRLCGADESAVDLYRNGALEQLDRHNQAMAAARADQNAFNVGERARLQSHPLASAQKWVGPALSAGTDDRLDGLDLALADRSGLGSKTYDVFNVRGGKRGKTIAPIQPAEQIAGEEGRLNDFDAIGVVTPFGIAGAEDFKSSRHEDVLCGALGTRAHF